MQWKTSIIRMAIPITILLLLIYKMISYNMNHIEFEHFEVTKFDIYMTYLCCVFLIFSLYKLFNVKAIYLIIVLFGVIYIAFNPYYSLIDEGAHFDYINHIITYKNLPTLFDHMNGVQLGSVTNGILPSITQYEAVHPPLYYLVAAAIASLVPGTLWVKFFALRFFGLLMILVSTWLILKTYQLIQKKEEILKNDFLFYCLIVLFIISPGFMTRMITLSNEHLLVPLTSFLLYILVKFSDEKKLLWKHIILLSCITAALILTKLTAVYYLIFIVGFLLLKKLWKEILIYVVSVGILISPWFLFNIKTYGAFTGTKEHLAFVLPIVNPHKDNLGFYYILEGIPRMFLTLWNPQEAVVTDLALMISHFLSISLIVVLIISLFNLIQQVAHRLDTHTILIRYIFITPIVFGILFIFYGTISESVDILTGRYLYLNISALIFLMYFFISYRLRKEGHRKIAIISVILIVFINNHFMFQLASQKKPESIFNRHKLVEIDLNLKLNNNYHITNGIQKESDFAQTFYSSENYLCGLSIYFSTFQKQIHTPYTLILKEEVTGQTIREFPLDIKKIKDNEFHKIFFEPIKDSKGKKYIFSLKPSVEKIETPLTIQWSAPDVYREGQAYLYNNPIIEDAVFKLIYQPQ